MKDSNGRWLKRHGRHLRGYIQEREYRCRLMGKPKTPAGPGKEWYYRVFMMEADP